MFYFRARVINAAPLSYLCRRDSERYDRDMAPLGHFHYFFTTPHIPDRASEATCMLRTRWSRRPLIVPTSIARHFSFHTTEHEAANNDWHVPSKTEIPEVGSRKNATSKEGHNKQQPEGDHFLLGPAIKYRDADSCLHLKVSESMNLANAFTRAHTQKKS